MRGESRAYAANPQVNSNLTITKLIAGVTEEEIEKIKNEEFKVKLTSAYTSPIRAYSDKDFDYQDCSSANGAILTIHPGETLSLVYRSSTGDEQTIMEDVTFTIEELMTEEQKAKYQKPSYTSTDYHTSSGSHTTSRYVHVEEANNGNCIKTCTDSTDHTAHMYITNVKIPEKSTPGEGADDPV